MNPFFSDFVQVPSSVSEPLLG